MLQFPLLLHLICVSSIDRTHKGQVIYLENYSNIMSGLSHVAISCYFIHYTAYYEAHAATASASEDISKQDKLNCCRICSLIKLSALPLSPCDIKQQFEGELFSESPGSQSAPFLFLYHHFTRAAFSLSPLPFLPLSWFYGQQQSSRGNFCYHSREITLCC